MQFNYSKDDQVVDAEFSQEDNPLQILEEDPFGTPSKYSYKPAVNVAKEVQPISEMEQIDAYKAMLAKKPEVIALTNEIDINNPKSIEMFGQKAGMGISRISDTLLENTQAVRSQEISEMMIQLTNVMKRFDAQELALDDMTGKKGLFGKLRQKTRESLENLVSKYDNLGKDVDKISQILSRYLTDIDKANGNLLRMYDANAQYYKALECYVVAAELGLQEIEEESARIEADPNMSPEEKSFALKKLEDTYHRLEQRKVDLQTAEMVSLQLQPTLAIMMNSNYQLMGKINTSFIITLPIFKISLANAVMLKRQEIQARSIAQLDEATNELLKRNATNTMSQAKEIAKMSNTTGVKIETLESIQQTILNGVNETGELVRQASAKRKEDSRRIDHMINDLRTKGFGAVNSTKE